MATQSLRGEGTSSEARGAIWTTVKKLFVLVRAGAGPFGSITVVRDAGDGVATIDVEYRSRYVTGAVGSKEDTGLNHVFRCLCSAERQPADALENAGVVRLPGRVCPRHRINIDAVKSQRVRRGASKAVDRAAIRGP